MCEGLGTRLVDTRLRVHSNTFFFSVDTRLQFSTWLDSWNIKSIWYGLGAMSCTITHMQSAVHHSGKSSWFHHSLPRHNGGSLPDRGGEGEVWARETVDPGSSPWWPVPVHAKDIGGTADTMMAFFPSLHVCPLIASLLASYKFIGCQLLPIT